MPSILFALAAVPLVACMSSSYTATQHGLINAPRPVTYDGQPMPTRARLEGHFSTARIADLGHARNSGAAVARHQADGAVRIAINPSTDLGLEGAAAWSATKSTLSGNSSAAVPDAPVIDAAAAFRTSIPAGPMRIGFAVAVGLSSCPIRRENQGGNYGRDEAALVRTALVPSYRSGNVTVFGTIGGGTLTSIREHFTVEGSESDPGVVAETETLVLTVGAGVSFAVADRTHLTAQIGHVFASDAEFGPQVMAGVAVDLGDAAPR
jgi:hypothetical protein